jgi:hypothetical protein
MLTVVASAVGPLALAVGHRWTGSYVPLFYALAVAAAVLAFAAWYVRAPRAAESLNSHLRGSR